MAGVLHPVGPEPAQTYWWRRLLILAGAVALVLTIVLITTMARGEATVTATPVPPAPGGAVPTTTDPPTSASPTPAASPTRTGPSAAAERGTSAGPKTPNATVSARASTPTPSTKPSARPASPRPAACAPRDLRATLTGERALRPKQATTFALSLINGSGATCVVAVGPGTFELKIYSGTDRIWSSDDCSRAVPR